MLKKEVNLEPWETPKSEINPPTQETLLDRTLRSCVVDYAKVGFVATTLNVGLVISTLYFLNHKYFINHLNDTLIIIGEISAYTIIGAVAGCLDYYLNNSDITSKKQ